jgi:hypothetical protein
MAFPVGDYNITLGKSSHANWQGSLAVTAAGTGYAGAYKRGQSNAVNVTVTSGANPNWIQFSYGSVIFAKATQVGSSSSYSGDVTGLTSVDDDTDTWTATTTSL